MSGHVPDRTGLRDSMGREIRLGDLVLDAQGFEGRVVFVNGAYRYDIAGGHYLTFHSSLIFDDGEGSRRLTVIQRSVGLDAATIIKVDWELASITPKKQTSGGKK